MSNNKSLEDDFPPLGSQVVVHKQIPFKEKSRASKYRIKQNFTDDFLQMCENERMTDEEVVGLLDHMKRKIQKSGNVERKDAIQICLSEKSLKERNDLTVLLTHSNGELNVPMLDIFPTLRSRSMLLLASSGRKEREDKIDLSFVNEFMHGHCRFALLLNVLIMCCVDML
jgi:hypothetical protein